MIKLNVKQLVHIKIAGASWQQIKLAKSRFRRILCQNI